MRRIKEKYTRKFMEREKSCVLRPRQSVTLPVDKCWILVHFVEYTCPKYMALILFCILLICLLQNDACTLPIAHQRLELPIWSFQQFVAEKKNWNPPVPLLKLCQLSKHWGKNDFGGDSTGAVVILMHINFFEGNILGWFSWLVCGCSHWQT